ncbi:MAG: fatty acid desaturase [Albidovulum sp.]|nr:fatty acid desaturase [Albidovulum sp.]
MKPMLLNASGKLSPEEATCIPEGEAGRVYAVARFWVAIYLAAICLAIWFSSLLQLMIVGMPRLYGAWRHILAGVLQRGGLAVNLLDHWLSTRTAYKNPISGFICLNMNDHVEHHMFPIASHHALPKLQEMIAHDHHSPNTSMWQASAEARSVVRRQLPYEEVFLERKWPATAKSYRPHPHDLAAAT